MPKGVKPAPLDSHLQPDDDAAGRFVVQPAPVAVIDHSGDDEHQQHRADDDPRQAQPATVEAHDPDAEAGACRSCSRSSSPTRCTRRRRRRSIQGELLPGVNGRWPVNRLVITTAINQSMHKRAESAAETGHRSGPCGGQSEPLAGVAAGVRGGRARRPDHRAKTHCPCHAGHDSLPPNAHFATARTLRMRNIRDTHGKSRSPSLRHVLAAQGGDSCSPAPTRFWGTSEKTTSSPSTCGSAICPASCSTSPCPLNPSTRSIFNDGLGFDGSSIRGFQAIHESDMLLLPDPTSAVLDPFRTEKTLNLTFFIHDPLTGEAYSRDPRNVAKKAETYLAEHRHRRHRVLRAGGRVLHLRRRALRDQPALELLLHRRRSGRVEHRSRRRGRQPRLQGAQQGWLLPGAAGRPLRRPARRDEPRADQRRPAGRAPAPRSGQRRPGRDQLPVRTAAQGRRRSAHVQIHHQERRVAQRQDRDVHAEASLRRQRLGHALPPELVEGRRAAVLRRARLRRPLRHGAALHRRSAQARTVAARVHQPDGQQLPPAGARLRSSGQPGLQPAQPVGLYPDPDHRQQPEGQAARVPGARPVVATRTSRSRR